MYYLGTAHGPLKEADMDLLASPSYEPHPSPAVQSPKAQPYSRLLDPGSPKCPVNKASRSLIAGFSVLAS